MARTVTVRGLQQMQRQQPTVQSVEADPFAIDPAAEDAAGAARLKEIGCGSVEPEPAEPTIEVAADPLADLLHGSDESDYPAVADVRCDECGGEVVLRSAEEDRRLASRVAEGVEIEVLCDACAAAGAPLEPKPDDQAEPEPTIADHLRGLNVEAACTAEMSLSMITQRVRERSYRLSFDHDLTITNADIVAEAERIWISLDRKRSHTYSVDADGSVRDWRRPDTSPDRGPDVGTNVHQVGEEPRFSGAGAEDGQQASMFPVPADAAFNGKFSIEAPELAMLADDLINRHGYLEHLEHCEIRYWWQRKGTSVKRRRLTGGLKRGSGHYGQLLGADFAIFLAADLARERQFNDRRVERALFRELRKIGQDEKGNFIELPYTLQFFTEEIVEYADVGDEDLKANHRANRNADQMGLFSDEDDDESGGQVHPPMRDGAGVLIHADGTPLTDDEIEAMERRELADDDTDPDDGDDGDDDDVEAFDAQEDGDPLADVDL